jgi:glutamine amidotransferase
MIVSVLDYGLGNLGSILNMFKKIGVSAVLVDTPDALQDAEKIVLPGVGSFDNGMTKLAAYGYVDILSEKVQKKGAPILGICLGMQLLGNWSEEGKQPGLGFIDAHCERFISSDSNSLKVPHMGWNNVHLQRPSSLFVGLENNSRFYFVHTYRMLCSDASDVLSTTEYGGEFVSSVQKNNIMGVQFHPEKSHRFGMTLLKNFSEL